jgi:hypothetical protein
MFLKIKIQDAKVIKIVVYRIVGLISFKALFFWSV